LGSLDKFNKPEIDFAADYKSVSAPFTGLARLSDIVCPFVMIKAPKWVGLS